MPLSPGGCQLGHFDCGEEPESRPALPDRSGREDSLPGSPAKRRLGLGESRRYVAGPMNSTRLHTSILDSAFESLTEDTILSSSIQVTLE